MKTIVITGASKGIGFETAKNLANSGHRVIAIARSGDKLEALQKESTNIIIWKKDIRNINESNFDEFLNQHSITQLDILINNAGLLVNKPFLDIDYEDFLSVFEVNFYSALLLSKVCVPYLLRSESSHIVNISSVGGVNNTIKFPGLSVYSSSKGALSILSECLAEELKETNIKVNCLALGAVQTEMLQQAFPDYEAPVSSLSMANYVSNFALEQHKYMNGQIVRVALSNP